MQSVGSKACKVFERLVAIMLHLTLALACISQAWGSSVAAPGCTCISHSETVKMVTGMGKVEANLSGSIVDYPANYGNYCGKQAEPGSSSCWNLTTGEELPGGERAGWCDDPWRPVLH